ncbi:hypothetical protein [Janthinobacterium lividum]|uniref:hypothetical protein n=1 Tax=Janthinobacterium lividum TaxID=29581 RepID=UPI001B810F7E|nr:hypothetical protein [Janthinobacterium lividum]MBR7634637.1 hypothetical protein [Janthinobacterium lividum]
MRSVVTTRMLAHPGLKKLPRGCRRINVMVHFTEQLAFSNRTIDEGGQKSDVVRLRLGRCVGAAIIPGMLAVACTISIIFLLRARLIQSSERYPPNVSCPGIHAALAP